MTSGTDFLGFRTGPAMFFYDSGSLPRPLPLRICVPKIQNDAHGIIVCACGSALLGSSQNCMDLPRNWPHDDADPLIDDADWLIDDADLASSIWFCPSTMQIPSSTMRIPQSTMRIPPSTMRIRHRRSGFPHRHHGFGIVDLGFPIDITILPRRYGYP